MWKLFLMFETWWTLTCLWLIFYKVFSIKKINIAFGFHEIDDINVRWSIGSNPRNWKNIIGLQANSLLCYHTLIGTIQTNSLVNWYGFTVFILPVYIRWNSLFSWSVLSIGFLNWIFSKIFFDFSNFEGRKFNTIPTSFALSQFLKFDYETCFQ